MSSSFLNPSVTPVTALATRLRARPWNFFSVPSSRSSVATSASPSLANRMPGGTACLSDPFGPLTSTAPAAMLTVTPLGSAMGFFPIRDMCLALAYHTLQSTSPPTPAFLAARPVITPCDVVRMLVPRPPSTVGTSSTPK